MSSSASRLTPSDARRFDPPLDEAGRHAEHRGVAVDDVLDAGALHLHHDVLAGLEHGAVGLADRRRRERLEVERRELLLDRRRRAPARAPARTSSAGTGRAADCSCASSVVITSGRRSLRVDAICPNFTNMPPQSSSVSRSRRANSGVTSFDADA